VGGVGSKDVKLFVARSESRFPIAVAIAHDQYLPRLTTDRAILNEYLAASAERVDLEIGRFAAIRTAHEECVDHASTTSANASPHFSSIFNVAN
jgi:hypothetical protein